MKALQITLLVLIATTFKANAQQDPMLTQYMFNGLYLNPAYAGSHQYWSSTFTYRAQWVGADFKGAPQTIVGAVDGPIPGKNMGLGGMVYHDQLGMTAMTSATAVYSYQLKFTNESKLAFGINAGVTNYSDIRDPLIWDENDVQYQNNRSVYIPKIGLGAYYFADKYYVGLSVPTLLAYQDGTAFSVDLSKASFLRRHYLMTAGVVIDVNENVKFKPSFLLKYVNNAPLEGDINFSAIFKDQFWIGASYRTGDAVALILEYQTNAYFRVGYAYDITVSGLRTYQNGSHEIMIGVDFGKDLIKVKTPRYF